MPTARRDLEALSASGIPVYPQAGRGGGWQLVGGAHRSDRPDRGEARLLFLLLGPGGRAGSRRAHRPTQARPALPALFRDEALAAADAVVHDPAGWGEQQAVSPADHVRRTLQDAVVRRRRVDLTYAAPTGSQSVRVVDPWGPGGQDGRWYLVAGTDAGRRTFRLDRVVVADVLDAQATRPADLDLGAEWGPGRDGGRGAPRRTVGRPARGARCGADAAAHIRAAHGSGAGAFGRVPARWPA